MEKVKTRAPNYTNDEKAALLEICKRYQSILESKKTGSCIIQQKRYTWQKITEIFNSLCTNEPREEDQLRRLYQNTRYRAKTMGVNLNDKTEGNPEDEDDGTSKGSDNDKTGEMSSEENEIKGHYKTEIDGMEEPSMTVPEHHFHSIMVNELNQDQPAFDDTQRFNNEEKISEDDPPVQKRTKQTKFKDKPCILKFSRGDEVLSRVENLKNIYFRKKIQLTSLQIQNEKAALKQRLEQHQMQMKVLSYQLEKAKRDCESDK